jgi:predicted glycosyltransferase
LKKVTRERKIWIDLDNSPHVPLFMPIMRELEKRNYSVILTTRDCFQVCGLADHFHLNHKKIGKHYGANKFLKVLGTVWRAVQLAPYVIRERPVLSLSHGSRSLMLLSTLLRIPTIMMFDYEHARILPFIKPVMGIAPEYINHSELSRKFALGLKHYRGLKEDVYVASYKPDPSIANLLGIRKDEIVATVRPPATEAHYHNPESEVLFVEVVELLGNTTNLRMIILPRNEKTQRDFIFKKWPNWCAEKKIIIPDHAVNGLDLIWHSDLVISGGGTMNREAAALGVPVYSIFRGKIGAVDRYLSENGRLILLETVEDVRTKILLNKRIRTATFDNSNRNALGDIVKLIEKVLNETK